jgi:hypothetical protein
MVIDLIEEIKSDLSDAKTNLGGSEEILLEKKLDGRLSVFFVRFNNWGFGICLKKNLSSKLGPVTLTVVGQYL